MSIYVESSGVVWRDTGGAVTIQCRLPKSQSNQEVLILKKGLSEKNEVLHIDGDSGKNITATKFQGRLQLNGVFPNMDILIKNLTSDDTGPYWCKYKRFDQGTAALITTEGNGSVLLVVIDERHQGMLSHRTLTSYNSTHPIGQSFILSANLTMIDPASI